MTLLDRILERGYEMPADPIMVARLQRHVQRIKPDPLFQRRLRGQVMNRYVATREGMLAATRPVRLPSRGLSLLGRGMLYASLLTAVTATAVGAAAQGSLPGDVLYGVKLELESIRMELAPAGVRDDLAAMAVNERLEEVEALAAAGRWAQLDAAVAAVERAQARLAAFAGPGGNASAPGTTALSEHVDRLTALLSTAPDAERRGLLRALAASGGRPSDIHSNGDHETANRGQRKGHQGGAPVAPVASATPAPPSSRPAATPPATPTATPTAEPTDQSSPTSNPGQGGGPGGGQGGIQSGSQDNTSSH